MTPHASRAGEAGFLLAEMLATLTISAFVLVGLVGLGPLMLRTADRGVAAMDATDDLGRTLMSLGRLVRTARRARLDGTTAQPFLFEGDAQHLILAHGDDAPAALPVTRAVALRIDPDGRLYRTEAAVPQRLAALVDLRFGPPHLVYAGGPRLRFAFVGQVPAGRPAAPARPRWEVGDRMPGAVTIEAVDTASGRVLATVRSPIAADADIGCVDGTLCGRDDGAGKAPATTPAAGATP